MAVTIQELRRKLHELGTNYSQVLLGVRHEIAKKYLRQNKLALSEITQLLGFSDQSNFTKAFKRWQAETPVAFRKNTEIAV
ncbi:helix-turn-helix domain-containing protein [Endozoicomonas sp.]|uniref:helix-turn-helix domain-containing protein n=1 Tax=Endozoicomonas sp. TaxID=1892382 RepID=UPI00383B76F3